MVRRIKNVGEVVDALGGTTAVQRMLIAHHFVVTIQAVHNWRVRDAIPAKYAMILESELSKRGYRADPTTLGMLPKR